VGKGASLVESLEGLLRSIGGALTERKAHSTFAQRYWDVHYKKKVVSNVSRVSRRKVVLSRKKEDLQWKMNLRFRAKTTRIC